MTVANDICYKSTALNLLFNRFSCRTLSLGYTKVIQKQGGGKDFLSSLRIPCTEWVGEKGNMSRVFPFFSVSTAVRSHHITSPTHGHKKRKERTKTDLDCKEEKKTRLLTLLGEGGGMAGGGAKGAWRRREAEGGGGGRTAQLRLYLLRSMYYSREHETLRNLTSLCTPNVCLKISLILLPLLPPGS